MVPCLLLPLYWLLRTCFRDTEPEADAMASIGTGTRGGMVGKAETIPAVARVAARKPPKEVVYCILTDMI